MDTEPLALGAVAAARRLGIDRKTLARWRESGIIRAAYRLPNGGYRYLYTEIERVRLTNIRAARPTAAKPKGN